MMHLHSRYELLNYQIKSNQNNLFARRAKPKAVLAGPPPLRLCKNDIFNCFELVGSWSAGAKLQRGEEIVNWLKFQIKFKDLKKN